ncbi:MAG: cytochrome c oxidase subunit II, partial [Microcystaceae cyanobacterium]
YNNMGGLDPMASHDAGPHKVAYHHHGGASKPMLGQNQVALASAQNKVALGLGNSPVTAEGQVPPVVVNVNGIQYAWIFTYPDTGIVAGELHIPVGRPVQLNITAGDVLHAFWLPEFRLKQDAVPGRDAELVFTATRLGEYPIICAELCGAYHGGMKTKLYVQTEEEFNQWVQSNTMAQAENLENTLAVNAATLSEGEFLAPYAEEMGIKHETLEEVRIQNSEFRINNLELRTKDR